MKWIVLPAALALAAGCGGDGSTGPEPGEGALIEIAPGSPLFGILPPGYYGFSLEESGQRIPPGGSATTSD